MKKLIKHEGKWRLFDPHATLIIMDESTLDRIIEDPAQPLEAQQERGFSGEKKRFYEEGTSLLDVVRKGQESGAKRLEVSYDFFFGGTKRQNYPDSKTTVEAYKVINKTARDHGMGFSASVVSPLDIGGGYAQSRAQTEPIGMSMQFKECELDGGFETVVDLQTQWMNNKGPMPLVLKEIRVFAFDEKRVGNTPFYAVDENAIDEITNQSGTRIEWEIDKDSITVTGAGYGHGRMTVKCETNCKKTRALVVPVYETQEIDYFDDGAADYMKSIIALHEENGIAYQGFYSDEMHIQFDWDLENHFGHDTEINARYVTPALGAAYAKLYGPQYRDFAKYLLYFAYHQHDFLQGEEGRLASQHVFGESPEAIRETWMFRKRYYELLQRHVVDLCIETKRFAEERFGGPIMTRAHATWQESPTCDRFFDTQRFSHKSDELLSRYDYTPHYVWSASIREDMSACYDYFKWNEYLTGGGTDHPEGGFLDRNYYGCCFAASLALLNKFPFSYYGFWGGPKPVMDRLGYIGIAYGNQAFGEVSPHNLAQGLTPRQSDVLMIYPIDLNSVEERFGSWVVQYGYADMITEEQLHVHYKGSEDGLLTVRGRQYRAVVTMFSPLCSSRTVDIMKELADAGGRVIWCGMPPLGIPAWNSLFGAGDMDFAEEGICALDKSVSFYASLASVPPMRILTDLLPDLCYPVEASGGTEICARVDGKAVGTFTRHPSGGISVYLGFRPRDDQSGSTGQDIDTLFRVLCAVGAYAADSCETISRPADSPYLIQRFPNGAVTVARHLRSVRECWYGSFFRDEEQDKAILDSMPPLPSLSIEISDTLLNGHNISISGEGAVTFRIGDDGVPIAFVSNNARGISVDGKAYNFLNEPADIAWLYLDPADLADGTAEAIAVKTSKPGYVTLPIGNGSWKAGYCGMDLLEIRDDAEFDSGTGILKVAEGREDGWFVVYSDRQ